MLRSPTLTRALFPFALVIGCEKAMDDETNSSQSQGEASEGTAAVTLETEGRTVSAQAEADMTIAAASSPFLRQREDFRNDVATRRVDLDQKVAVLDARSRSAAHETKADIDARLALIDAKHAAFAAGYATLETPSALMWDEAKARLDKERPEPEALVDPN